MMQERQGEFSIAVCPNTYGIPSELLSQADKDRQATLARYRMICRDDYDDDFYDNMDDLGSDDEADVEPDKDKYADRVVWLDKTNWSKMEGNIPKYMYMEGPCVKYGPCKDPQAAAIIKHEVDKRNHLSMGYETIVTIPKPDEADVMARSGLMHKMNRMSIQSIDSNNEHAKKAADRIQAGVKGHIRRSSLVLYSLHDKMNHVPNRSGHALALPTNLNMVVEELESEISSHGEYEEDHAGEVEEDPPIAVHTTHLTCPAEPCKTLAIKLSHLTLVIKNLKKYFTFEVQILDDKNVLRRILVSNYQTLTKIRPFFCVVPMELNEGWNKIQLNLADFTRRAYDDGLFAPMMIERCAKLVLDLFAVTYHCLRDDFSTVFASDTDLKWKYGPHFTKETHRRWSRHIYRIERQLYSAYNLTSKSVPPQGIDIHEPMDASESNNNYGSTGSDAVPRKVIKLDDDFDMDFDEDVVKNFPGDMVNGIGAPETEFRLSDQQRGFLAYKKQKQESAVIQNDVPCAKHDDIAGNNATAGNDVEAEVDDDDDDEDDDDDYVPDDSGSDSSTDDEIDDDEDAAEVNDDDDDDDDDDDESESSCRREWTRS